MDRGGIVARVSAGGAGLYKKEAALDSMVNFGQPKGLSDIDGSIYGGQRSSLPVKPTRPGMVNSTWMYWCPVTFSLKRGL